MSPNTRHTEGAIKRRKEGHVKDGGRMEWSATRNADSPPKLEDTRKAPSEGR